MRRRELQLTLAIVLVMLLTGCPWFGEDGGTDAEVGKLRINIASGRDARSILPPVTMEIADYFVEITGPGPTQNATVDIATATTTFSDLEPGDWTVRVEGRNADPSIIAVSEQTVSIAAGTIETISMIVGPVPGQGSLVINLAWPDDALTSPEISATLTPESGTEQNISAGFAVDTSGAPDVAVYAGDWDTGYYTLALTLVDGEIGVWYEVAAVRILDGATSIGEYLLEEIDLNLVENGGLNVNIGAELQNPYEITLTGWRT